MPRVLPALVAALVLVLAAPAAAAPPNVPSAATAQSELAALPVRSEASTSGYSRDLFPHWTTVSGTCSTREQVLRRDGDGVTTDSACYPTGGSWWSQYDAIRLYAPSEVDIDHVVPLAEAWRSGAATWTTDRRRSFANDLTWPQLIAVSASSNRSKGDQDPSTWQPRSAYRCTYARMWIRVKHRWGLHLQSSEKSALQSMLGLC
jgi:hypothetical protein